MKKIISLITMISISGLLLIGCGNTSDKKGNVADASVSNSEEEYTISSTASGNGKPVKEEKGTVLINKDGIKTKVADDDGNKVDKDLDIKLRKMCEELSKICESKDIEARPTKQGLMFALMGDIKSMTTKKQEIINYLKSNPVEGYKESVMIGSRTESGGENFEVK